MPNKAKVMSLQHNKREQAVDLGNTQAKRGTVRIDALLSGYSPRLSGADKAHVRRLAEASAELPPIIVHRPTMRIIDGTHRVHAAVLNGKEEIEVEFFDGSADEAFLQAVELNIAHGLPLTMAERKLAATRIVASSPNLSDRAIARSTGLSDKTVAAIRRSAADTPQPNARHGRDGRVHPVNGNEGRHRASQTIASLPDAPLREVARLAGISVSTAKDVRDRLRRGDAPFLPERKNAERSPADAVQNISFILEKLKRDPSLRFSDNGREFLHLLQLQCTVLRKWTQLAEKMPGHCTAVVTQFARQCAEEWSTAAKELQKRSIS